MMGGGGGGEGGKGRKNITEPYGGRWVQVNFIVTQTKSSNPLPLLPPTPDG